MATRRGGLLRGVLILVGLLVVAVLAVVATFASAFVGLKGATDGQRLPSGAVLVKDGFANAYVLPLGPGRAALVDCGMDASAKALRGALGRMGVAPDGVEAIFLTHGHPDHTGGCKVFPKAAIYALAREVALVEGAAVPKSPMTALTHQKPAPTGLKVAKPLTDGETVQVGPLAVRALALPGHTPGSAAYLVQGVLYVGDGAGTQSDGGLRGSAWIFSTDTNLAARSLAALAPRLQAEGVAVAAVATGHSAPAEGAALAGFTAGP